MLGIASLHRKRRLVPSCAPSGVALECAEAQGRGEGRNMCSMKKSMVLRKLLATPQVMLTVLRRCHYFNSWRLLQKTKQHLPRQNVAFKKITKPACFRTWRDGICRVRWTFARASIMKRFRFWILLRRRCFRRVGAPSGLYAALRERVRYQRVWAMLEKKTMDNRRYAASFALHEELDLRWILENRGHVVHWLLNRVRQRSHVVSPACESVCRIGEKERILYRMEWPDRVLQTVLAQALSECWEGRFHPRLFSYRKGRSAVQAARLAARFVRGKVPGPVYVLKRDVKSYGDRIPHGKLFELLDQYLAGVDPFVRDLIRQFIAFPYRGVNGEDHVKAEGLPTGMPLNCVLENLYLSPVDDAMGNEPGVSYMRYGDDIWLSTASIETARRMRERLDNLAAEWSLTWHREKSFDFCLAPEGPSKEVASDFLLVRQIPHLGVVINRDGHIDIPPQKLQLWRKELKSVLRRANAIARRLGLEGDDRVRHVVLYANQFLDSSGGRFPKMDYLLTVVTHDQRFIEIDRWVAQSVLAAFYGRFSKVNFRKTPFGVLKKHGLKSLYLRRQAMYIKAAHRGARARA